ncbi:MAG: hypothetical protein PSX79_04100 [bacterium]|mgnify:CR=1 FL=1|nr:hypothetical protein [bacterium]
MTIRFDIGSQSALAELVARMEAGEDVLLTRDGETVALVTPPPPAAPKGRRQLGVWEHLNLKLSDDLFIGPDPEIEAEMDNPIFPDEEQAAKN